MVHVKREGVILEGTSLEFENEGVMNPAVRPTSADPTMQGVVAVIALAVNVVALGFIIKRSIEQKKNPYKNEIFTDQKDFQLAMARAEGK